MVGLVRFNDRTSLMILQLPCDGGLEFLVDVVWVRRLFGLGEVAVFVRLELAGAEIEEVGPRYRGVNERVLLWSRAQNCA